MTREFAIRYRCTQVNRFAIVLTVVLSATAAIEVCGQEIDASTTNIKLLIEQLGHDRYAIRSRAIEKLQQLGLEAFDELHKAQYHEDNEIVSASRFLISSLMVSWSKESDPVRVREALSEYGGQDPSERASRIELIARLPDRQGLEALIRLVRFEPELRLSRKAAFEAMQQTMGSDEELRRHRSELIANVLQQNDRQAAKWLRVYAKDLVDGTYSAKAWRELLRKQRREMDAVTSQKVSRATVLELTRICAARAIKSDQRDEAVALAKTTTDLIQPTTRDLVDASNWAIDHKLHEFVLYLRDKNSRMFGNQSQLLYASAQAEQIAGNQDVAEKLADQALLLNSFPSDEKEKEALTEKERDEIAQAHLLTAEILSERGLFDWSEREYRRVIDNLDITSYTAIRARSKLAFMFGEMLEHAKVVEVLEPFLERIAKDDAFGKQMGFNRFNTSYFQSELDFHRGMLKKNAGDIEAAKPLLKASFDSYGENVDILIAMFHLKSDESWNETILSRLNRRVSYLERSIATLETRYKQRGERADDAETLSNELNEYAWLVSNTDGDFQRALESSLRSLELTPGSAAKLDTCARCYVALDNLEMALETQRRAAELMPHSPPMQRQLDEIKELIAKKAAEDGDK